MIYSLAIYACARQTHDRQDRRFPRTQAGKNRVGGYAGLSRKGGGGQLRGEGQAVSLVLQEVQMPMGRQGTVGNRARLVGQEAHIAL